MSKEKTGLVLEGGAMRGIYTAGVLDEFMEAGITTFISQESGTTTRVIPYETEWLQKQLSRWMDWTK